MGLLEDKLKELHDKDPAVKASLEATDAVKKDKDGKADKIDLMKVERKNIYLAKAHIYAGLELPMTFVHDDITITVTALELDGDAVRVVLDADRPHSGPFRFVNAPLNAIVAEPVFDPDDPLKMIAPQVLQEDPDTVLKIIVGRAVSENVKALETAPVNTLNGWSPELLP